jgi:hypothetical protein
MGAFDFTPNPASQQEVVRTYVNSLLSDMNQFHQFMVSTQTQLFDRVWHPDAESANAGVTPTAILAELGTRATDLFAASQQLANLLNSITPGCITLNPPPVAFHQDGTVTLA